MRKRVLAKLQKRLRRMEHEHTESVRVLRKRAKDHYSLEQCLRSVIKDPSIGSLTRAQTAELLNIAHDGEPAAILLDLFFQQEIAEDLWNTAFGILTVGDRRVTRRLIDALQDNNSD